MRAARPHITPIVVMVLMFEIDYKMIHPHQINFVFLIYKIKFIVFGSHYLKLYTLTSDDSKIYF